MKKQEFNKFLEEDLALKFWDNYYNADLLSKHKILQPIVKRLMELSELKELSKEQLNDLWEMALTGYFDDLMGYMCMKEDFQKESKSKK